MNEIERVVLDALWPVLGGNHTDAETWQKISDAVTAAIAAMRGEPVSLMDQIKRDAALVAALPEHERRNYQREFEAVFCNPGITFPLHPTAERIDMSEQLKACDQCGGKPYEVQQSSDWHYGSEWECFCHECGHSTGRKSTPEEAITAWNTRTADAENQRLRAEVEALREACREYDLALATGFPNGAAGNVFVRWNRARNLTRKAPQ